MTTFMTPFTTIVHVRGRRAKEVPRDEGSAGDEVVDEDQSQRDERARKKWRMCGRRRGRRWLR